MGAPSQGQWMSRQTGTCSDHSTELETKWEIGRQGDRLRSFNSGSTKAICYLLNWLLRHESAGQPIRYTQCFRYQAVSAMFLQQLLTCLCRIEDEADCPIAASIIFTGLGSSISPILCAAFSLKFMSPEMSNQPHLTLLPGKLADETFGCRAILLINSFNCTLASQSLFFLRFKKCCAQSPQSPLND